MVKVSDYLSENYSIPVHLLEVYKTDEENFTPYVPLSSYSGNTETTEEEEDEENTDIEEEESTEEEDEGFSLHQGEIQEKYFYISLSDMDWDMDYEGLSNNGSATIPYTETDLKQCYLGVRVLLRKGWQKYGETVPLKELPETFLAFIVEETFSDEMTKLSLSGMSKLLEQKYQFNFTQMKRSDIIKEVIKTAGLIPSVNVEGLDDPVIDYTNISSDSGSSGGSSEGVSADVAELAKKVCKGKSGDRSKANAICNWIGTNIAYPANNYTDHRKCPSEVISSGYSNCCDRARLGYQMGKVVGLTGRGVHGPNHVWVQYQIDGEWVDSDPAGSRKSIGSVLNGMKMDRLWDFEKQGGTC